VVFICHSCTDDPVMEGLCQWTDCQIISGVGHIANIAVPRRSLSISGELAYHEKQAESGKIVKEASVLIVVHMYMRRRVVSRSWSFFALIALTILNISSQQWWFMLVATHLWIIWIPRYLNLVLCQRCKV